MSNRLQTTLFQHAVCGLAVALLFMTGCSNVLRAGLVNDTSILLPPSAARTIYVQIRNTSENQGAAPSDIPARLSAKGYTVVMNPSEAAYLLQTRVVYCHKAGDGVRPETVAKTGFGAGIGRGGSPLGVGNEMDGSFNAQAMRAMAMGGGAMPDINAMMRMAMSGRGGFQGIAPSQHSDDSTYLCVADVLVTEQPKNGPVRTYKMRSVAHVLQKKLSIEEATPIVREKFGASITGAF